MLQVTPKLAMATLMIVLSIGAVVGVPLAYWLLAPVLGLPQTHSSATALGVATSVGFHLAVRRIVRMSKPSTEGGGHVVTE